MFNAQLTRRIARRLLTSTLVAVVGLAGSVQAGPEDQGTKYPVGIKIGDTEVSGIVDSGGTTTLSFEDAKKLGLLDENGDPKNPADGSVNLGGTGGGSVKCHVFNKVKIKVQPKNADGTNNGAAKEVEVKVYVPKKPSEQDGDDDAAKAKKTGSVVSKVGANVAGATIDGSKLVLEDKSTADPKKNERGTGWVDVPKEGEKKAPVKEDDHFEDEIIEETYFQNGTFFNGMHADAYLNTGPITGVAEPLAQAMRIFPQGQEMLDFQNHSLLFLAGWTDIVPDPDAPMFLSWGYAFIQIPTDDGGFLDVQPVRTFILPMGFVQNEQLAIVGGNGLIPADHHGWLDNEADRYHVSAGGAGCVADFNGDGTVNTRDVLAFLNAWTVRDPRADINGDGRVDTLDVLAFLNLWSAGC